MKCGLVLPLLLLLQWRSAVAVDTKLRNQYLIGGVFSGDMKRSAAYAGFKYAVFNVFNDPKKRFKKFQQPPKIEYVDDISDNFQMSSAICRLVSRGALAIFGPIHYKTVNMVMSLTDYFEIIYFTYSDVFDYDRTDSLSNSRQPQGRYIVRLRPVLTPVVISFVNDQKWKRIFYLYDTKEALLRLRGIFEAFNQRQETLSADPRSINANSIEILKFINSKSKEKKKRIVLDITSRKMRDSIFQQVDELRMKRADYHYLVLGVDINEVNLTAFRYGGVNISGFSLVNYTAGWVNRFKSKNWFSRHRMDLYPCVSDEHYKKKQYIPLDAALMLDGVQVFFNALNRTKRSTRASRPTNEACIPPYSPEYSAKDLADAVRNVSLEGLTGLVRFDRMLFRKDFNVSIIQIGVRISKQEFGYWSEQTGMVKHPKKDEKHFKGRNPLQNKTRIVTSIITDPFLMIRNSTPDGRPLVGNDRYKGFCADLIEIIARRRNFKYVIRPVKDGKYGTEVNETWNGMIGELVKREADIAVAPLTITSAREKVVDFTKPYMEVGLSVMYVKPERDPNDVFSFMKPLSTEIWMCIAFAYLGVSVVLFLVSRFSPYEWHFDQEEQAKITNDFSIFNSFWFSLSAFMQQGGDLSPRSLSGRIVGSVWWFFTLIIVSSYTANLAAFLTVERMSTPIQSYKDLAKQSKIKYGVVNSGSSKDFFKSSNIPDFRRMWQFMRSNPHVFVRSIDGGYNRVKNSNRDYAFLLESTMNEYYEGQEPCTTMKVGPNLDSGKGYGIATPPGSDLRDQVNLEVLELKEMNKIHELKTKWWLSEAQEKCKEKNLPLKSSLQSALGLSKVWGLFYILLGGLVLGVVLSIVEFVYRCALEAKRRKCLFNEVFSEMIVLVIRSKLLTSPWSCNNFNSRDGYKITEPN